MSSRSRSHTPRRSITPRASRSRSRTPSRPRSRSPAPRRTSQTPPRSLRSPTPPQRSAKIVVEKLTKNVTEAHVREIFGSYGEIKEVDMPMNRQCKHIWARADGESCLTDRGNSQLQSRHRICHVRRRHECRTSHCTHARSATRRRSYQRVDRAITAQALTITTTIQKTNRIPDTRSRALRRAVAARWHVWAWWK